MAKQKEKTLVDCTKCEYSDTEPVNCLLPCRNKERNPKGSKVGAWRKECKYFKQRK